MPSAVIVVPCYNEARRLDTASFRAFAGAGGSPRFVLVDDGSTDGTRQVLASLCAADPEHFTLLVLPGNVGKAEAVRQGVLHALAARPDYVGYWDADLATPLSALPAFCDLLAARPDLLMVFGARVRLLGRVIERRAPRHYLGRVFATGASLTLGLPVYDTQCGAKLLRVSPEIAGLFAEPFASRWLLDVELLARLIRARRGTSRPGVETAVYELPLAEWRDVAGSNVGPGDLARGLWGLAVIYWKYLRPGA